MSKKRNHIFRKIQRWYKTAVLCRSDSSILSKDYFHTLRQAIEVCSQGGFQPEEAHQLGLFLPDITPDQIKQYVSKNRMTELQLSINPKSWISVTEDKAIFYRYADALGLPIPRLYALYFKDTPGITSENRILTNRKDWISYLEHDAPEEFVIKPSRGVYGMKIYVFIRSGGQFKDPFEKTFAPGNIYNLMEDDKSYDHFIIQERLKNHPDIVRLTDTPFLQTIRISSYVDNRGETHILHASLRMIVGNNVTDNFSSGDKGNIIAPMFLESGILKPAKRRNVKGIESDPVRIHPKTGASIEGFVMPLWEDCRNLIKEAAIKLLPIRTLGWDIAVTPNGPMIVEANMLWDPPNQYKSGRVLMDQMEKDRKQSITGKGTIQGAVESS